MGCIDVHPIIFPLSSSPSPLYIKRIGERERERREGEERGRGRRGERIECVVVHPLSLNNKINKYNFLLHGLEFNY